MVLARKPLAGFLGLPAGADLTGIGVSLVVFALVLFATAQRKMISQAAATLFVVLDLAWVVGSGLLIARGLLSRQGDWAVAIVADIVLVFAILQAYGLHRVRKQLNRLSSVA